VNQDSLHWIELLQTGDQLSRPLDKGEALFRQGDPATCIYRVTRGRIRLLRHLKEGTSVVVQLARPGETFAEAALFSDRYHCEAIADTPSAVTVLPKTGLLTALSADQGLCMDFAQGLAEQVRDLRTRLELRNIRSASERILTWLRLQTTGVPPTVWLDRPWTQVAPEIGLTAEAVYRSLAALEQQGRIVRHPDRVELCPGT
jgi:CRP-like cAMP-binding protein